ncbi:hypothetical protein WKW79_21595 [Variovorax robiniae]|uniref:DUF4124 domain-containing protein n=1 Tax=Variovorax robiniae TaxID=1836199 RepID=A0ABU8XBG4_9BURK
MPLLLFWIFALALLYLGGRWLLALRSQRQTAPVATSVPNVQRQALPSPSEPSQTQPQAPAAEPPLSVEITKCVSGAGRAEYSDGPCAKGSRAVAVRVQPDINLADGMSPQAREASRQNNRALALEVRRREEAVARNVGFDNSAACRTWEEAIASLDALARQPNSPQRLDWIRDERKALRDRRFRAGCR